MEFLFVLTPKEDGEFAVVVYQKRPGLTNLVVYTGSSVPVDDIQSECVAAKDDILGDIATAPLF